jgi:hypothetical protein
VDGPGLVLAATSGHDFLVPVITSFQMITESSLSFPWRHHKL